MTDLVLEERQDLKRYETALATRQFEIVLSGFGMVCSLGWTLANRGSKYWQEQWESKIEDAEKKIAGPWFRREEPRQDNKGWWLSGRQYSVSKIAIAVSDYVLLVWVAVFLRKVWFTLDGSAVRDFRTLAVIFICLVPVFYLGLIAGFGRSSPRSG